MFRHTVRGKLPDNSDDGDKVGTVEKDEKLIFEWGDGKKSLKSQFRVVKDKNRVFSAARSINFFFRVHHKTSINSKFGGLCLLLAFDGGSREFRVSRSADCAAASCFLRARPVKSFLSRFFFGRCFTISRSAIERAECEREGEIM